MRSPGIRECFIIEARSLFLQAFGQLSKDFPNRCFLRKKTSRLHHHPRCCPKTARRFRRHPGKVCLHPASILHLRRSTSALTLRLRQHKPKPCLRPQNFPPLQESFPQPSIFSNPRQRSRQKPLHPLGKLTKQPLFPLKRPLRQSPYHTRSPPSLKQKKTPGLRILPTHQHLRRVQ